MLRVVTMVKEMGGALDKRKMTLYHRLKRREAEITKRCNKTRALWNQCSSSSVAMSRNLEGFAQCGCLSLGMLPQGEPFRCLPIQSRGSEKHIHVRTENYVATVGTLMES